MITPIAVRTGELAVNTYFIPLTEASDTAVNKIPVFVIDPGDCTVALELREQGLEAVAIVLTHGHFDHVLGLRDVLTAFPNIKIGMHSADKTDFGANMSQSARETFRSSGYGSIIPELEVLPSGNVFLAEGGTLAALFSDRATGSEWQVLSTPGHTKGCICLYNAREKILISGDTLFAGTWGRTDLVDGSEAEMAQSLSRLYKLPSDTRVFPGHGKLGFTLAQNPIRW